MVRKRQGQSAQAPRADAEAIGQVVHGLAAVVRQESNAAPCGSKVPSILKAVVSLFGALPWFGAHISNSQKLFASGGVFPGFSTHYINTSTTQQLFMTIQGTLCLFACLDGPTLCRRVHGSASCMGGARTGGFGVRLRMLWNARRPSEPTLIVVPCLFKAS